MPDYKAMYIQLFNRVTDAISLLQLAQIDGEDTFVSSSDKPLIELSGLKKDDEEEPPQD